MYQWSDMRNVPFCAQKGARVLEGLAASGLRSIRYALEIDGIARIDANDLDGAVVEVPRCLWTGPVAVYVNPVKLHLSVTAFSNIVAKPS